MTLSRSHLGQGSYVLGSVMVSGNPGAVIFGGEVARTVTLAIGLVLVTWSCIVLSPLGKPELLLLFGACSPIPLIELLVRVQQQTALHENPLLFRLVCYLYYICGILIALSLRRTDSANVPLFVVSTIAACALSLGYLASLGAMQVAAGRQTIDDALNPVGVGYSFGLVVVTALGILLAVKANLVKPLCLSAMILGMGCVVFTGSRGALLSLLLTIGLYFSVRTHLAGRFVTVAAFRAVLKMVCGLLVFMAIWCLFRETLEPQFEYIEKRFTQSWETGNDASMETRAQIRGDYLDHVREWWLFGYYRYDGAYPHNIFLEAWIRFGLFGLVLGGGIGIAILRLLLTDRSAPGNPILSILSLQGLFTLINAQTSLSLEFQRTLWGACGAGITLLFIEKANQKHSTRYVKGFLGRTG